MSMLNNSFTNRPLGVIVGGLCLLGLMFAHVPAFASVEKAAADYTTKPTYGYVMKINRSELAVVNSNVVASFQMTAIQDVPAMQSVVLIPVLVDSIGHHEKELPMIFLNSRNQQIYFDRGKKKDYPDAIIMRKKNGKNLTIDYLRTVKYEPWMDNAVLKLRRQSCACDNMKDRGEIEIARFEQEDPVIELYPVYLLPPADNRMKVREEKGSALLCFELNKWDIKPNYMTNPVELQKIHNSVNIVKSDSDVTIRRMTIEGYASPEGTLAHNRMLSEKRTDALKNYLEMVNITRGIRVNASGKGENWPGLLKELRSNTAIPQRDLLLSIAGGYANEDEKEKQMRKAAPVGYDYILKNIYPALRCTNYTVEYTVRPFTIEESERVFETRPTNLNLNEIYRLAEKYADNKEKYYAIIRKASMLYPDDSYINLTMAYLAIKRGNADEAADYLKKVKNCPEKDMNEGLVAYLRGDVPTAMRLVEQARQGGVTEAEAQMKEFSRLKINKK